MAIWATIWATYDTARLVGPAPDGPADRGAWPSVRSRGPPLVPVALSLTARSCAFLRPAAEAPGRLPVPPVAPGLAGAGVLRRLLVDPDQTRPIGAAV